jgi:very-short-patch-repair endonuclease
MTTIEQLIVKLYQEEVSTYEICERINKEYGLNYYPNKINRLLRKVGQKLRSKSESQKISLEKGRAKHPTEGRKRTAEEKISIGKTVASKWASASTERREVHSKRAKENWDKMSTAELADFRSKSAKAIRKASDNGSKLERYILGQLQKAGWRVHFHTNHLLPTGKLEMDMFVEDIKTVVEIDGISHFEPIHGQEIYERVKYTDNLKNALAIQNGYKMVRVRCLPNKVSLTFCLETYKKLEAVLNEIKINPLLPVEKRLIHI